MPDLRNSRVIDVIDRLKALDHDVRVHDPLADRDEAQAEYGIALETGEPNGRYDLVFMAVPHQAYRDMTDSAIADLALDGGLIADLKGIWRERDLGKVDRWTF